MKTIGILLIGICIGALITEHIEAPHQDEFKFVWNDDEESIPYGENQLIVLEFTEGNTIYIGPTE